MYLPVYLSIIIYTLSLYIYTHSLYIFIEMHCDPKLQSAIKAIQYSSQYIVNCSEIYSQRVEKLQEVVGILGKEENEIDQHLCKLK